ncbi:hypothetical protein [Streptomyces yaizuensis]|uniref:Uncharacterized protein n=1 Tax=Streptomyces yaizuensis TaxID=2989713 RepID=A0ABQ5P6I9_9ACTN|nr:hypothetical protein [Streptomyces sp. YSPA8]GLF98208.1 hypothetical protein SYYSPA8_27945 [Streptomyces sp. YSPA8]
MTFDGHAPTTARGTAALFSYYSPKSRLYTLDARGNQTGTGCRGHPCAVRALAGPDCLPVPLRIVHKQEESPHRSAGEGRTGMRTGPVPLTWEQRAGLGPALLYPVGRLSASVRGAALGQLLVCGSVELRAGIAPARLELAGRAARFHVPRTEHRRSAERPQLRHNVMPCAMRRSGGPGPAGRCHLAARRAAEVGAGQDDSCSSCPAEFGLLRLGDRILDYGLRAGQGGTVTAAMRRRQAHHLAVTGCRAIVLVCRRYADMARQVWSDPRLPLAGARGIGDHLAYFAAQYRTAPPLSPAGRVRGPVRIHRPRPPLSPRTPDRATSSRKDQSVPFTPDLVLVRHPAHGLQITTRRGTGSVPVGKAVTGHVPSGGSPGAGRTAEASARHRALAASPQPPPPPSPGLRPGNDEEREACSTAPRPQPRPPCR